MLVTMEDIKLFLEDYPHVSLVWIRRLDNMVIHESAHKTFNVIRSGLMSFFKVTPFVEVVCNYE